MAVVEDLDAPIIRSREVIIRLAKLDEPFRRGED